MHVLSLYAVWPSTILDHPPLDGRKVPDASPYAVCYADGIAGFYDYYQLDRGDESAETETEPGKQGELRSEYVSSHSPFGLIWQIAEATGWSKDYILDGVNYQTLLMMIADAPHYSKIGRKEKTEEGAAVKVKGAGKDEVLAYFQSNLH